MPVKTVFLLFSLIYFLQFIPICSSKTALADISVTSVKNGCLPSETGEIYDQGLVRDAAHELRFLLRREPLERIL